LTAAALTFAPGAAQSQTVSNEIADGAGNGGSGAWTLAKTGAGTLTLSAANTYSNGTTVTGGLINFNAANNFGSGLITLNGGGLQWASGTSTDISAKLAAFGSGGATFDTNGNNVTLGSALSGAGGLTKTGAGTLTLSGASNYAGATNVNAGTLQGGAANVFASGSAFTVASGAFVDLNGFNQSIGSLAGAGTVTNSGGLAARLRTGFDDTSTTFSGVIQDGVSATTLIKLGAGTFMLSGANTYSGSTQVMAGTLIVNGSIANSATTVNNGGILAGIGTVGAVTVNSGGTLAPGSGTPGSSMTIAGNLAFQSGAFYLVQVNPSNASNANLTAGGTASLAGTVQAQFAAGSYVSRNYTILHSAGLNGTTFNSLSSSNLPVGFAASLNYTATDVILNLTATLGALGTGGLGGNQQNVANALNNFFNNGGTLPPQFVGVFSLTGGNLANALTLLSGEAPTGAQQGAFQLMREFLTLMLDDYVDGRSGTGGADGGAVPFAPERPALPEEIALAYASVMKAPVYKAPLFEQRWSVWGSAYGGYNRTSGDPLVVGSHDLTARAAGFAAGMDYRVAPSTVVGFALAGGGTNWGLAQGLGSGKSDAFQAGVYATTRSGPAYLAASLAYTNHWMSTDRFAVAGDHLTASFNAQSVGARVETGYRIASAFGAITPYAALTAQSFRTPNYNETDLNGGGFGLAYNARTATDTRSELGARFDKKVMLDPTTVLALRARLAWAHDWISDPTLAAVFQALPGAGFIVNGATPAKNSALVSAGSELRLANGLSLIGKFDGELARHSATYAGTGTVRYTW
jgi:outer membrane autotransporter protein